MKEQMDNFESRMKTLWGSVCVKSKALLAKARKWTSHCASELSANAQDLFLKTVTWIIHTVKGLLNLVVTLVVDVWMGIWGLVLLLLSKVKAVYHYFRNRKAARLPGALQELVEEERAEERHEPEIPEMRPILVETVEDSAVPAVMEKRPRNGDFLKQLWKVLCTFGRAIKNTVKWIWRLRGLLMSLPVAFVAIKLAMFNMERLPELVGLDIQASGEFAHTVSREMAVYGPLGITAFCILLAISSKKPLFPWVISVFSLVLPPLLWFLNYYA